MYEKYLHKYIKKYININQTRTNIFSHLDKLEVN